MYMGRFIPKEGKNREKETFYFVDTQELQSQSCKIISFNLLVRTCSARLPTAMLIFCCHKCHRWSILGKENKVNQRKKQRKSPKMQAWKKHFSFSFPLIFSPSNHLIVKFYLQSLITHCQTTIYNKVCDTCDSKKVKTPVDARAYAYAREDGFIGIFTIQFPRFSIWTFPCRSFPIHCVLKNEPLFLTKRHVVSLKTTRRFSQNKPLFFLKQAVVFPKTSRRFSYNKLLFFIKQSVVCSEWPLDGLKKVSPQH